MATKTLRHPDLEPSHPGALLREYVLPGLNMPVSAAAKHLGISRQTLHRILAERASITPEMALRIGKFCGNGPGIWLRMQESYDLWHAERTLRDEIARIPTQRAPLVEAA
jgi:antitoxin HigA-1